jgi:hypothetical protein
MRALWLGPPAAAAPFSRLGIIIWWRAEQRVFKAHISAVIVVGCSGLQWLGVVRDWTWVTCDAGDQGVKCEEGEGVDDEEVRDKVVRRVEGQIVIVEEDVQD